MASKAEKAQKYFEHYKINRDDTIDWREASLALTPGQKRTIFNAMVGKVHSVRG